MTAQLLKRGGGSARQRNWIEKWHGLPVGYALGPGLNKPIRILPIRIPIHIQKRIPIQIPLRITIQIPIQIPRRILPIQIPTRFPKVQNATPVAFWSRGGRNPRIVFFKNNFIF